MHANTAVDENDRAGLERLLRYASRPPLAQRRLSVDAAGRVHYRLRRPYYTGQTELVLEPVDFLRKLAALVPPPRHQVRFYDLLAPQAHDRERFERLMPVPPGPTDELADDRAADPDGTGTATEPDAGANGCGITLRRIRMDDSHTGYPTPDEPLHPVPGQPALLAATT